MIWPVDGVTTLLAAAIQIDHLSICSLEEESGLTTQLEYVHHHHVHAVAAATAARAHALITLREFHVFGAP